MKKKYILLLLIILYYSAKFLSKQKRFPILSLHLKLKHHSFQSQAKEYLPHRDLNGIVLGVYKGKFITEEEYNV